MSSLEDQAKAIWKTLDELSDKDPSAYHKFIQEQLNEGAQFFKANTTTTGGVSLPPASSKGKITSKTNNNSKKSEAGFDPMEMLGQLFAKQVQLGGSTNTSTFGGGMGDDGHKNSKLDSGHNSIKKSSTTLLEGHGGEGECQTHQENQRQDDKKQETKPKLAENTILEPIGDGESGKLPSLLSSIVIRDDDDEEEYFNNLPIEELKLTSTTASEKKKKHVKPLIEEL